MLHSQIITASDLTLLRSSVSRPREIVLTFERNYGPGQTALSQSLKREFGSHPALRRHFLIAERAETHLGSWCADQVWRLATSDGEFFKLEAKTERKFAKDPERPPISVLNTRLNQLQDFKGVVQRHSFASPELDSHMLSSKVKVLLKYLETHSIAESQLRCIIFVEERWTALLLQHLLKHLAPMHIRPEVLIGNNTGEAGDLKVSFRKQLGALNKFRKGDANCLIATSIAEEGLDIPDCNLVIRFDLYTTLIQYIQSRGRARHALSVYVHMLERGNPAQAQKLRDIRCAEDKTREFCEALPVDRLLQGSGSNPEFEAAVAKERRYRRYVDPETKAILTYGSSLVFLAHFVSSLPSNGEEILQPTYHVWVERGEFICEVILPDCAPIHSATGLPESRKSVARRSAAFQACLELRQGGHIDHNFISTYHKTLPKMRNARLALTSNKRKEYDMKLKPKIWDIGKGAIPDQLYMTILELEDAECLEFPCQPLVLLSRAKLPQLPAFPIHIELNKSSNLLCSSESTALPLDSMKMKKLDVFTLRIFKDVFNKLYEADEKQSSYWLAPALMNWRLLNDGDIIDWSVVNEVFESSEVVWDEHAPAETYLNRYLIDRWHGGQRYFSVSLELALRPTDPVPPEAPKHKFMQDILNYTISLFSKSRTKATWNEHQAVFRAHQLLQRLNWLDDFTIEAHNAKTKTWICLEPLHISAVSTTPTPKITKLTFLKLPVPVVSMARMFPGIITRLESYLIALEAFEDFGLQVQPALALEALTKDSDNTEAHKTEQIHVQRGMGKNYERLEFIGDCFMKMATSIALFSNYPEDNEFDYHVNRMLMICNKNLQETALKKNLYESVRTMSFSRCVLTPPPLDSVD